MTPDEGEPHMHEIAKFVFWMTLVLYAATLIFVSYVGVYLTYVAIPVVLIFGLIMKISKPNKQTSPGFFSAVNELMTASNASLDEVNALLSETNSSLKKYNRKQVLVRQRTLTEKEEIAQLRLRKVEPEINLKYAKNEQEKNTFREEIEIIDKLIKEVEQRILEIEKQCELEVARSG